MPQVTPKGKKSIRAFLPVETHRRFSALCAGSGMTVQDVLSDLVTKYLTETHQSSENPSWVTNEALP